MKNFVAYNPTNLYFGKDVVLNLGKVVSEYGKKVLFLYGKGSIKKNDVYTDILAQLKSVDAQIFEFDGIKSNPLVDDVDRATKIGIENNIDVIIAAGGGSVLDSAKIVAVCISNGCKGWDVMKGKVQIRGAVPLIGVLTLAATGSEMNSSSVLQNHESEEKIGFSHPLMFPKYSFLDPSYTITVPADYTAYGIVDLIAHCLENFFGDGQASLSDRFVGAIIKEAIEIGPKLMNNLTNFDYRSNIMWASTCALNGTTSHGRKSGDWGVHSIGHILSLLYDIPHGASLSIVYPAWLKYHLNIIPERIAFLGKEVYGISSANTTILKLEEFLEN
ncbi:MAG: iron-containing alcohol dehydrogenase [Bacteroidetes bacterium]|nr:iron-containing alcohol dehydrogenase [Bacteroidota bacterium]